MEIKTQDLASDQSIVQIHGDIERVTYRNDENGWTVAKVRVPPHPELVTVTGSFTTIHEGLGFEMFGRWSDHPHYGKQFKAERSVILKPKSKKAIKKYLGSGAVAGIGPKTADKIVDHFGVDTLDIFETSIKRLIEVPGLGKKKRAAIIESWEKNKALHEVNAFMSSHGISPAFSQRILKEYGQEAVTILARDPYKLAIDIRGIGFLSADRIAESIGILPDSQERVRAGIKHVLTLAEDSGHSYLTSIQLSVKLSQVLALEEETLLPILTDALTELNEISQIVSEFPDGSLWSESKNYLLLDPEARHYDMATFIAERSIAKNIARLLKKPIKSELSRVRDWVDRYCLKQNIALSSEQKEAVEQATESRVFVLTGGPGVGKTTTANLIIRLFLAMGKSVALCAPTGRAAQRLSEVSQNPAKTIHRLLEWNPQLAGFSLDEKNPLLAEVIIVDESSMIDVHLGDCLLRAIRSQSQVIFIGDADQLPSVGPGQVLGDLIASKCVPFKRLAQVFRQAQSSAIVSSAHAMNSGDGFDFEPGSDCQFFPADEPDEVKSKILSLYSHPILEGYHPMHDVQVLTPMNRGSLGTQTLNEDIQNLLNPVKDPNLKPAFHGFRDGDKVIQTSNNYDLGVFNGDIGLIKHANVDGGKLIVYFGSRALTYTKDQIPDLKLAYAISIHKSQGSEFPVVIIPSSMQHYIMLQRNLMYTALTRARKLAIFVGSKKALNFAIKNAKSEQRQSALLERLQKQLE